MASPHLILVPYRGFFFEPLCTGSPVQCPGVAWFDSGFLFLRQSTEPSLTFFARCVPCVCRQARGGRACRFIAVVRATLVSLVWIHFALFTFLLSSGQRYSMSWSVWNRRTVLPRFSGRARRRHWQRHVLCWFVGESAFCAVVPSVVDMLKMLGIRAGLDQKDSYLGRLWRRSPSTWTVACARLVLLV